jgi:ATP-dependent protease ClpP protease subunit
MLSLVVQACAPIIVKPPPEIKPRVGKMSIDRPIDYETVEAWTDEIQELDRKNDIIIININSGGGSVDAGYNFIDAMQKTKAIKVCVADRIAMSMAFVILQACDQKVMTRRGILMIHRPYIPGQAVLSRDESEVLKALVKAMTDEMARTMKVSGKYIREKISEGDWYINWEEALDVGAVDRVIWTQKELDAKPILGASDLAVQ